MGKAQKKWARGARDRLRVELGGVCVDCGTVEDLEFDVIIPLEHDSEDGSRHHRVMEFSQRISFYRAQARAGNLALRCARCNGKKGGDADKKVHAARREGVVCPF